jgi:sterol desaturase/sphingolipid hydroxylase (fatty acid hydroxylase superfamily)
VRAVAYGALPALVLSAALGTWILLRFGLPVLPVLAAGGVFYAGLVILLERLTPYSRDWQQPHGDVVTDLMHLAITGGLVESAPALGLGPANLSLWPVQWPLIAQILLVLLLTELLNYWVHRLMHGPLWRFHAVHHSARRLYWMNSWRVHPVEGLTYCVFTVMPLLVLGAPAVPLTIVWAFSTVFRMLQHSNVDVRLGPLNWIFAGPELHRWHHSPKRSEQTNYGNVLAIWDVLFKTRRMPESPPLEVGLDSGKYPTAYAAQLLEPFRSSQR